MKNLLQFAPFDLMSNISYLLSTKYASLPGIVDAIKYYFSTHCISLYFELQTSKSIYIYIVLRYPYTLFSHPPEKKDFIVDVNIVPK